MLKLKLQEISLAGVDSLQDLKLLIKSGITNVELKEEE